MVDTTALIGKVFGRGTVVKYIEQTKNGVSRWGLKCECGKYYECVRTNLIGGHTKSCGCLSDDVRRSRFSRPPGINSFNALYNSYRIRGKEVGGFDLTKEEFRSLTSSNCFYCGCVPKTSIQPFRANGAYIFNGLDRVDSTVGYTKDNVVPCCTRCNFAKHRLTQTDFYKLIKTIYEHKHLQEWSEG